jgi:adenylylsulfate kinase
LLLHGDFLEVYSRCPVEVCEQRDPKGHYRRARDGNLAGFTGVSAPYEEPADPELILETARLSIEQSVDAVMALLNERGIFSS